MKLKSIISKLKKGENEVLEKIKVTKYIPFSTKRAIVKNVAMQVTYKDEDLYTNEGELIQRGTEQLIHDSMLQELLTFAYKVSFLTDIVIEGLLDEDNIVDIKVAEEAYDLMCGYNIDEYTSLYDFIESNFINDDIYETITYEVEQELNRTNSTANILKVILEDIISNIPTMEDIGNLMTQIPNQLESLKDLKILNSISDNKTPKNEVNEESKDGK